jgi:predicted CXXCH cytochrome family protein
LGAEIKLTASKHNFVGDSWNGNGGACGPCHTPHNSIGNDAPLWSHTNSTATFTYYSNSTMNASMPSGTPNAYSLMCLSCHDGVTAVDGFIGEIGTAQYGGDLMGTINATANVGTDLRNDHPISILYDDALRIADGELHNPTNANVSELLFNNYVECSSCHNPHGGEENTKLLRVPNTGSALCLRCHNK